MIPFNKPPYLGIEDKYITEVIQINNKISGDGPFTKKANKWFEDKFQTPKALVTTSCTHALEMSAMLCNIQPGDEIIMPSYTFVSTANAFVLQGAKIIFIDINPLTMNMDETLIEQAITNKTKAIVPVHYAGVSCNMDVINDIAKNNNIFVIEDAAQGVMSKYHGKYLGTLSDFGCYSFHETKNYSMGEGGALTINNTQYTDRAEIIREKGTNRSKFYRGQIDKYSWVDIGSSYLPSEMNVAYLYAQLEQAELINNNRLVSWNLYNDSLKELEQKEKIILPFIPEYCQHNGHMFYIKCHDIQERTRLINHLKEHNIGSVFHYIPLHSSQAGQKFSEFRGKDIYTTTESEKLLRLPMYYGLTKKDIDYIIEQIYAFW